MAIQKNEYTVQVPDVMGSTFEYFHANHSLLGIDTGTVLRWGIFIGIWIIATIWHYHQNRAFHEYLRNKKKRTPLTDRLSQLAFNRTFEIFGLFFVLVLTIIFYDTRVYKAESSLENSRSNVLLLEQEISALEARQETLNAELAEAESHRQLPENIEEKLDVIKQKYEELFINYYYLKRCNAIAQRDFHLMNSGLIHELTELNAPAGIRKNILTAAKGTHDEMYKDAPCTPDAIEPMQQRINDYLVKVIENLPDQ